MAAAKRKLKVAQIGMEIESEESEPKRERGITKNTGQVAHRSLEKQIIRQIEYYFGDINLPKDKFLQDQLKLDDGWIPMEVLLKFNRLSRLSSDPDVIVTALGKASNKLMEISEDKKKIRRSPNRPLPVLNAERRNELRSRTLYVKGFPAVGTTLNMLVDFFAEYGPIDHITMRSYPDKINHAYVFRESVFVIFETREKAEEFLNAGEIKYQETELIKKWQSVYVDDKKKEKKEIKRMQKAQKAKEEKLPKGAFIHLSGFSSTTTREEVKEHLAELGADVAYIHYNFGKTEARVRLVLHGENTRRKILAKIEETKFLVNGREITARAMDGDEEEVYLQKARDTMKKRRHMVRRDKKSARGGSRGGRGPRAPRGDDSGGNEDRKRKGSPTGDEPPAKQAAMEQQ